MKNAILEMWYGNLDPARDFGKSDERIKQALILMVENGKKVEEKLDKEGRELFIKYCDSATEHSALSMEESFSSGFCLGVRLTAEAILGAEKFIL